MLAQENITFYVGEAAKLTFADCDSFPEKKIDNPILGNSYYNSSLFQLNFGEQMLLIKVSCLGQDYNALINSGSSHSFTSQQVYKQLKKIKKGSNLLEVEQTTGDKLQVVLADGSSTESKLRTRIKVNLQNEMCVLVECNIIRSLVQKIVLGMLFLWCMNQKIDWNLHIVKFQNGNYIQAVPVAPEEIRPYLQEISAKTAVQLARYEGSASLFALIRGPSNVQSGLLASTIGSIDPVVVAPPQSRLLFDSYNDFFAELGQVTHRTDLLDESSMLPRQRAYRMSPAELAESRR